LLYTWNHLRYKVILEYLSFYPENRFKSLVLSDLKSDLSLYSFLNQILLCSCDEGEEGDEGEALKS